MNNELATTTAAEIVEQVVVQGDLAKLSAQERATYYARVCESLGLNPLTRPFAYITLNGHLTLYARKDATDQLRTLRKISVTITSRERMDDLYVVVARAKTPSGRTDESIGAVGTKGLAGDRLANALMKAETKAKRRVTLSICGLGWTDGTEIDTIPDAQPVDVDVATGMLPPTPHWSEDPQNVEILMAKAANDLVLGTRDVQRIIPDWTKFETGAAAWAYLKQHAGGEPPEDALEALRTKMRQDALADETPAEDGHRGKAQGAIEALFINTKDKDIKTNMRHMVTGWLIDKPSSRGDNGWTRGECYELITWAANQDGSAPRAEAIAQARQIIERVEAEAGQQKLEV